MRYIRVLDQIQTVLITGASGGIGEAFARDLAAREKDLILVARSETKLETLADELSAKHGIQAHVIVADLARHLAAEGILAETERLGLAVDLLINNAGYGKTGAFGELGFDVQADMVRLNVNTLVELTRLYLPAMRQRQRGGVINVASTAAFQPTAMMAVYSATKAFVLNFSVGLAEEVAGDGVAVMALCPGATATGFWATATGFWATAGGRHASPSAMHTPERVVVEALRAFGRRSILVPGFTNRLAAFASSRLLPRPFVARMAGRVLGQS